MHSTPTAKPSDDPHDILVVAPDVARVAPAEDELSSLLHEAAARYGLDSQSRAAPDVSARPTLPPDLSAGPTIPPVDTMFRPAAVNDNPVADKRRSMVGAAVRAFTALLLALCIGVAAFVWRSYGDTLEKKIARWTTQFVLTASSSPEKPELAAPPAAPGIVADAASAAPVQPAAPAQTAAQDVAPAIAAPPSDAAQLQSMSRDLASLGQQVEQLKASIEQLKTGQQQASREIAKVSDKASEPNTRPKLSALPPRPAVARQHRPMPPYSPPQAAATAPVLPPAAAPYPAPAPYYPPNYPPRQTDYLPRPPQAQPQYAAEPPADPELSSVPRPPMPLRQ
jgi:hypothetical protein